MSLSQFAQPLHMMHFHSKIIHIVLFHNENHCKNTSSLRGMFTSRERERERERETERERQRDRETETDRQRERQRDRQKDRETDKQTERQPDRRDRLHNLLPTVMNG